jgi:hypothetical protein
MLKPKNFWRQNILWLKRRSQRRKRKRPRRSLSSRRKLPCLFRRSLNLTIYSWLSRKTCSKKRRGTRSKKLTKRNLIKNHWSRSIIKSTSTLTLRPKVRWSKRTMSWRWMNKLMHSCILMLTIFIQKRRLSKRALISRHPLMSSRTNQKKKQLYPRLVSLSRKNLLKTYNYLTSTKICL